MAVSEVTLDDDEEELPDNVADADCVATEEDEDETVGLLVCPEDAEDVADALATDAVLELLATPVSEPEDDDDALLEELASAVTEAVALAIE